MTGGGMTGRLADKVAVVTGASRGLGYALAKALAREGAHVVAVARTVGGLEELDDEIGAAGGSATLVPADLKDFPAIDRLGEAIFERWKRLDILVGNAGVLGQLSPLGHIKPKVWDEAMAVNVTANWRLIRSLDPLLREAPAGRAVFVTTGATVKLPAYWGAYSVTKAALEALVKTYAAEISKTEIRANLFNPGPTRTAMRAKAFPGEDPETLPTPDEVAKAALPLCLASCTSNGAIFAYADGQLTER
jgi:NAD(P)-dependent dehydrogenase (short-subunit alcohol dehydrogenase family)